MSHNIDYFKGFKNIENFVSLNKFKNVLEIYKNKSDVLIYVVYIQIHTPIVKYRYKNILWDEIMEITQKQYLQQLSLLCVKIKMN